ncbi:MAG TPA: hypothetical protein VFC84_14745 [Desulfosporosinus sp.]|nr:hypothetical protein [Desulfosporosinus sp.]
MRLLTEDEYNEMSEEGQAEWDYRQRIEDQRQHEADVANAKKHQGFNIADSLNKKRQERVAKYEAEQANKPKVIVKPIVEKVEDVPKVKRVFPPNLTARQRLEFMIAQSRAADEPLIEEVVVEPIVEAVEEVVAPVKAAEPPRGTNTKENDSKGLDGNVEGVEVDYFESEDESEDFTTFVPMDSIKFSVPLFMTGKYAGLSTSAFKLWLILTTRLKPNGWVAIEIEDVPRYARRFRLDPKTVPKALEELKRFTITTSQGKDTRTVHLLKVEVVSDDVSYYKIPYASGAGTFDGKGKDYAYPQFIKWNRQALENLLMTIKGSPLRTLFTIGVHVDDKSNAFPSWETISKYQGITLAMVGTNLNALKKVGLLKWEHVPSNRNKWKHNYYELDPRTGIKFC